MEATASAGRMAPQDAAVHKLHAGLVDSTTTDFRCAVFEGLEPGWDVVTGDGRWVGAWQGPSGELPHSRGGTRTLSTASRFVLPPEVVKPPPLPSQLQLMMDDCIIRP